MSRTTDGGDYFAMMPKIYVEREHLFHRLSCAMVAGIDEGIGQIIKELQSQVLKKTIVLSSPWNWRQDKDNCSGQVGGDSDRVLDRQRRSSICRSAQLSPQRSQGLSECWCNKRTCKMNLNCKKKELLLLDPQATLYEGGVRSPGFIHAPKILPRWHGICKSLFFICWLPV